MDRSDNTIRFVLPSKAEVDAVIARANQERRELLLGYLKRAVAAIRSYKRPEKLGEPALR